MGKHLKLKAYRALNQKSQGDMAKLLGITIVSYNRKENGKDDFTLQQCKKLADCFGLSIDSLFLNNSFLNENNVNTGGNHGNS